MAIIEMKKLTLVGYGKDKSRILRNLQKTGCVEIQRSALLDNTFTREDSNHKDEVTSNLMRLQFVFDFLKTETRTADGIIKAEKKAEKKEKKNPSPEPIDKLNYNPGKRQFFHPAQRFGFDQFYEIAERIPEIDLKIAEIEKINSRYADIKAEIIKLQNAVQQLEVFRPVAAPLSAFADTAHTAIMLGVITASKRDVVERLKSEYNTMYAEVGEGEKLAPIAVIALKDEVDKITEGLNEADFIRTTFTFDMTAAEKIEELNAKIKELADEKKELLEQSLKYKKDLPDFQQLYDYYSVENARLQAADGFALTKTSFILEGWFPAEEEQKVLAALNEASDALVIETREPVDGDPVPTLTRNNKLVSPYECITNMYSPPAYTDVDPNPFVAFFYFLMFGIMMGDAVYGLMLLIGGLLIYKFSKPVPGKGKLVLVIAMGGLSTFIWGILFGGWMSFDVSGTFLEKLIWFKPIDETNPNTAIYMLVLGLGIGVVQILVSMGIHGYDLIKHRNWLDAIVDVFAWYFVYLGIGLFAISIFVKVPALKTAGIVIACIGVAAILILGGHGKKGFKKATGGLGKLYGIVNFLSDVLSYSRLFGLGLATCVIGMVVNNICGVIMDIIPYVGIIIAAPIFVVGHLFNIGINTLGTYIHNARLQFIEFFSRFYQGGGHQFMPLGSNTKYTYIEK